jgi:hypothetical protein
MDATEAQLRFGSALSDTMDTTTPTQPTYSGYTVSQPASQPLPERTRTPRELRLIQAIEFRRRFRAAQMQATQGKEI